MLRTRVLHPRWLATVLVLWAVVWVALPAPAEGAPLPPARATASGESADGAPRAPAEEALRRTLVSQGLTPGDIDFVLARLTPAERTELAQRAEEVGVGGDGTVLIIILVLIAAILLYLPMAGKMQGWW
jgi:hypothetical protein